MKDYQYSLRCEKCGFHSIKMRHVGSSDRESGHKGEHLVCICARCAFTFLMRTRDYERPANEFKKWKAPPPAPAAKLTKWRTIVSLEKLASDMESK